MEVIFLLVGRKKGKMLFIKKKLGELLLEDNLIKEEDLVLVHEYMEGKNIRIGRAFIELGIITEENLLVSLSKQLNLPLMKMNDVVIRRDLLDLVSEDFVKEYRFFPFDREDDKLRILVNDPLNIILEDEIKERTGLKAEFNLISEYDLDKLIENYYDSKKVMKDLNLMDIDQVVDTHLYNINEESDSSTVVKIINSLLRDAVRLGASDIHISVNEDDLDIRFRIDGILQEMKRLPKKSHLPLTSRIKMMADMDITEKRVPQDGSIRVEFNDRAVDLRVSSLPSIYGEKVVIRLLDKSNSVMSLDSIGFEEYNIKMYEELIKIPVGIILVTGPTGSGKSSTLYATINKLNSVETNIVTIEDPVEYKLKGITQVAINNKVGLTFASGLKSILRQDPDIILVGEIRDTETAEIAVRASNTGHLVLSTLHTNSAVSSVIRLVDMGIEPYLVASTVMGVLNQRLVRRICVSCKERYISKDDIYDRVFFDIPEREELYLYKGTGCDRCNFTGYKGRVPIHELLVLNDEIRKMIIDGKFARDIEEVAVTNGMKTLKMDGLTKALKGITTLSEVRRFVTS